MLDAVQWRLLAQVTPDELGRGFRGATSQLGWQDLAPYAIAAALLGLGLAAYEYLKKRNDMSLECNDPHKLFRELCLAHELDRPQRRILLQLAEAGRFDQPAQVFLSPTAFDPGRLPPSLRSRPDEVRRLREQLFQNA